MKIRNLARFSSLIAAATLAVSASAEGVFVSGMASHLQLQNDRDFNSQVGAAAYVGYRFDGPWAVEWGAHLGKATEAMLGASKANAHAYRLEALYYVWEDRFSPYAAFGVGRTNVESHDASFDRNTNTFNLGGGFDYRLVGNLSFRGDLRFLRDFGQADNDVQLSTGLTYHFDQPAAAAKPVSLRRELDSDSDGVMDSQDRCPNSPRGAKVNEFGCTLAPVAVEKPAPAPAVMNVRLEVNFATDSSAVESNYFAEIEKVAEYMVANSSATVVIEGHTDNRGSEKYNQWLSARRAQAVADVLEQRFGIVGSRISSKGYGESKPLVANDSVANMATNRRVVAVISQ